MICQVFNKEEKKQIARLVLEALPNWFGIEAAREAYISDSGKQAFFAAKAGEQTVGFLCLKETGKRTVELAVMGVLQPYHRQGIGSQLVRSALAYAGEKGYAFCQVKTVAMGCYEDYDRTNCFYQSLGFEEFEMLPTLWGEKNPCQIYIMAIP